VRSILVEGGARLAGALLGGGFVDRLIIFRAPVLLGAGALGAFAHVPPAPVGEAPRFELLEQRRLGPDVMTVHAPRGMGVHGTSR
jgi:diaminohydroxyphosphoribosylaminopyrimidine deaminase/5-amino-6-(5-phosphoribosylamino)uracil reductase